MYQLLYDIDREFPQMRGGFIHVPYAEEQVKDKPNMPALPLAAIVRGLEICIRAVIENETDCREISGVES